MNQIGDKIKALRKAKGITQQEFAQAMMVSSQSISKWENHLSVPDITLLPFIARYFNISMDELFGYKLEALNHKDRFIRFMWDNGMLRFGNFILQSGRISPYLIHSGDYRNTSQISKLGEFFADAIKEHSAEANMLIGISERETPLVIATAMMLFNKYGIDTDYCISNQKFPHHREMTLITDTFTSGKTLKNALAEIKKQSGCYPRHIIVSVDRMEYSETTNFSAKTEIEHIFGVKIHSIVTFNDIITAIERGVINRKNDLERILQYRNKYVEQKYDYSRPFN